MPKKAFDNNIRHFREKKGLFTAQLAQKSGIDLQRLEALEKRQESLSEREKKTLARGLSCSVEDLMDPRILFAEQGFDLLFPKRPTTTIKRPLV